MYGDRDPIHEPRKRRFSFLNDRHDFGFCFAFCSTGWPWTLLSPMSPFQMLGLFFFLASSKEEIAIPS